MLTPTLYNYVQYMYDSFKDYTWKEAIIIASFP